jgi:8-amino-7-oxononanoate synthase
LNINTRIKDYLINRKENHLYRQLTVNESLIDFSSNDYLGFTRSGFIKQQVDIEYNNLKLSKTGATGSRLLNGNSELYEELEQLLAETHHAEAALLFNSGFDANVGLISTVVRPNDIIFYDELVHASIHQGMQLSGAKLVTFRHNNLTDLEEKLKTKDKGQIGFIITESVFSMEGDMPNLNKLADLAFIYEVELIIDEAHATGLFGRNGAGCCNVAKIENKCFARVYTFGKAIGSHGAVVVGSQTLKDYLVNFSKPFIYSTALDMHNLLSVKHSYFYLQKPINQCIKIKNLILYFKYKFNSLKGKFLLIGDGPIFGILVSGNENCRKIANYLQENGFDIRPIVAPTVPKGTERLRIILHSYNSTNEIDLLCNLLTDYQ